MNSEDKPAQPEVFESHQPKQSDLSALLCVDDNFGCQQLLKDILPNVRTIDIRIRMDGQYYWFEGDYLKQILRKVTYNQIDNDGIKCKLEDHKQIEDA